MDRKNYRALVVDCDPETNKATVTALTRQQFTCDQAFDGEEATGMIRDRIYDAVVTCLLLPKRHGHSLVIELLSQPKPPRIVVLTPMADPRLLRDLIARGVDDIVCKSASPDLLATKLLSLFEKNKWRAGQSAAISSAAAPGSRMRMLQAIEKELAELSDCFEERLSSFFDFDDPLCDPPKAINDFIKRLDEEEQESQAKESPDMGNTRAADRVFLQAIVTAVPVNGQFEKRGEPFTLALRDLSTTGIRMHNSRATNDNFLALSWKADTLPYRTFRNVIQVARCRPVGRFYEIAGQFVLADG